MKPRFLIVLAHVFFAAMLTGCTTPQITEIPENESHIYVNPEQHTAIFRVIRRYNARDLYITPNIPLTMLTNSRQACVTAPEEEILALIDSTILNDAKTSLLIGNSGIYMNNPWQGNSPGRQFIPYEEFIDMPVRQDGWFGVSVGGISFSTSACSMPGNNIIELLRDIQLSLVKVGTKPSVESPVFAADDGATLIDAAFDGDINRVRSLLDGGADVNAKDTTGRTALWRAADKGHTKIVKALLESKADVNAECKGVTALFMAAHNGHTKIISLLLEAGADVNAACKTDDITGLIMASQKELELWKQAERIDTLSKYMEYLKDYPNGLHGTEAREVATDLIREDINKIVDSGSATMRTGSSFPSTLFSRDDILRAMGVSKELIGLDLRPKMYIKHLGGGFQGGAFVTLFGGLGSVRETQQVLKWISKGISADDCDLITIKLCKMGTLSGSTRSSLITDASLILYSFKDPDILMYTVIEKYISGKCVETQTHIHGTGFAVVNTEGLETVYQFQTEDPAGG